MKAVTLRSLQQMKLDASPITMLTCYDATFARLVDAAGVDAVLVGDSLGMVVKGESNTLGVTIEEMAYHVRAVARGTTRAHLVGDLPFMSYQVSPEEALRNAATLMRAGAHAVKLEGGASMAGTVRRIVDAGIPVMGHIGLLPQSVHAQSGFVVQGRDESSRQRILEDALALEAAGAYAMVLEGIPSDLAAEVTARVRVPTIGIGAGVGCDGQVLVLYDVLGLNDSFKPKFVKTYTSGATWVGEALSSYVDEVRARHFPGEEHSFAARPTRVARVAGARSYGPDEGAEPAAEPTAAAAVASLRLAAPSS